MLESANCFAPASTAAAPSANCFDPLTAPFSPSTLEMILSTPPRSVEMPSVRAGTFPLNCDAPVFNCLTPDTSELTPFPYFTKLVFNVNKPSFS